MNVQPVARALFIGLGHEGGVEAHGTRRLLHYLLQESRVIGSEARVLLVLQIGLELSGRIFLAGGAQRNGLLARGGGERGKKCLVAVEIVETEDGHRAFARAASGIQRRLRRAMIEAVAIKQIEFELESSDWNKTEI